MFIGKIMLCAAGILTASFVHAATIDLTLSSDKDPFKVTAGEDITFTVGLTPVSTITGYTLDIRYDRTELEFLTATQLVPFFSGAFQPPFTLDPAVTSGDPGSTGLETSDSGRASILQLNNSDPVGNLFSLEFTVINVVADGLDDLMVGILSTGANDINPPLGGDAFTISRDIVTASITEVPSPATLPLMLSALFSLVYISWRKRRC